MFAAKHLALNTSGSKSMVDIGMLLRYGLGLLRSWYILLSATILFGLVSYLYIHREQDMYQSEMQILLKSDDVYDYQSALYRGLGAATSSYRTYEHIASEMRVIKSSSILNRVLDKLALDVSYFITGRIKTSEVFEHIPFQVVSNNFDGNRIRHFSLKVKNLETFELRYKVGDEQRLITANFGDWIIKDGIVFSIKKKPTLNEVSLPTLKEIDYSFKINDRNALLSKYKNNLELKNIEYTSVVQVKLRDNIPERAKFFLDTLGSVYLGYSKQNKIDVNENTLTYINRQIEEVTQIINEIGVEIESFKEKKSILNLSKEEELYFQQLASLEQEIKLYELKIRTVKELKEYVSKLKEADVSLPPSTIMLHDDPTLKRLVEDLYRLHLKRLEVKGQLNPKNPVYLDLEEQIDKARMEIIEYLEKTGKILEREKQRVQVDIGLIESKIKYIPRDNRELMNIQKRLEVNEELYSFLLSRRAETIIAKAGILPETKIIEAPRVSGVVYPNRQEFVIRYILIGLAVGVVLAFLKVYFLDKIETIDELSSQTELPILGMIPPIQTDSKLLFEDENPRSRLYDSFRMIRASLELLAPLENRKQIVVSSLLPSEGKTFSSINIAYILSRTKKRVVLVDCDMHKPRIMKAFGLKDKTGLSAYLTGNASKDEIIYRFDDYLHVIFSGVYPPNASELIASDTLKELLASLRNEFDYVIIDSPPVSLITDALILMGMADQSIMILNSKFTTKRSITTLEEIVQRTGKNNHSLVLNNAKRQISMSGYYGSYLYYYGYGGHGEGYGDKTT